MRLAMRSILHSLRFTWSLFLLAWLFLCLSCSSTPRACDTREWKEAKEGHRVLATTAMIGDIVSRIGGESIHCLTLICGELDPHSYQLVKGDDEKLALAEAIFCNGLGLEHGPSLAEALRDHPLAYPVGDYIAKQHPEQILYVDKQIDPHIWMDVSLWSQMIPYVRERLIALDPEHREDFIKNSQTLMQEMLKAHQEIQELMAQVPPEKRYIVTSHDAFQYFTRAYLATEQERKEGGWEARFAAPEGLAPESQVSARDIQIILQHLLQYHIQVLFPESNLNRDALRKIVQAAEEKGLHVHLADVALYGDAMGPTGSQGETYMGMLRHNAEVIKRFLMGERP